MYQPHNIFAFQDGLSLLVFVAEGAFSIAEFSDFVDRASLTCIPDSVSIIFPNALIDEKTRDEIQKHVKARFQCAPNLIPFDERGFFDKFEKRASILLTKAKEEIIRRRDPILLPPPGKCFTKPSGAKESYFIQASNLFVRHAEMALFALFLIREWGDLFNESIKTIYVDTIDLYGLVSLACRMRFRSNAHAPITVSFSSYSGFEEVLAHVNVSSSLMLISATTTHKLFAEILEKTRWKDPDRVVTLLALDSSLWYSRPKVSGARVIAHVVPPHSQPHFSLLPSIRLGGEKFSVEVDEPKAVVINSGAHADCLKHFRLSSLSKMDNVLTGYGKNGNRRVPLFVDSLRLFGSKEFFDWLKAKVEEHAPISTSHIVSVGDAAQFVDDLVDIFKGRSVDLISSDDLRDGQLKISGSVVVICPTFTSGTKLLEVSRDLRKQSGLKNIVYFTALGTPESLNAFQRLKRNLEHGEYQVHSFCNVCTGIPASLNLSWETELNLLRQEDAFTKIPSLRARALQLENGMLKDNSLFYNVSELEFHEGFKLWEGRLDVYPTARPSVLLFATFAFLLQNARVSLTLPDGDRLTPLPNRRVVLSPENFFRFNDSLIQVAIMRAAFPGELDFSDQEENSASMLYLLERGEQTKNGPLVYEFLLALTTGRLSLTERKLARVVSLVEASTLKECNWFKRSDAFQRLYEDG